jgi:integral membrane protein
VTSALTRYRVMAYITGVFLLLLCLNMILKYVLNQHGIGSWVPITHGWLYLIYVIVTVDLWFRTRLDVKKTVLVVLAGTIPFMSFVAERWVHAQVGPMADAEAAGQAGGAGSPAPRR